MASRNYSDLIVWQKAMNLVEAVYKASKDFPTDEQYGLTIQMRRAAVSIPSNIAEGQGRRSHRSLSIAHGFLRELETQLLIAGRLKYIPEKELQLMEMAAETGRLITGLSNSIPKG
ncbi:MAG: four helix bundle protein [Acidobacteria bacterium]|nr:four helix bundle protein [Acidobacteriota bacterium]